jgi:hypothetical protein
MYSPVSTYFSMECLTPEKYPIFIIYYRSLGIALLHRFQEFAIASICDGLNKEEQSLMLSLNLEQNIVCLGGCQSYSFHR